ncbi:MAG: tetratricopeptide repeat protein [Acidobacteria bacterium]|nr:MAG: tetratricopeptide repeat protein [Acidobacteriota bacterium]REK06355.1 MAG: tetratricopeptide repeat protein [Acidobacteriota bacterium]
MSSMSEGSGSRCIDRQRSSRLSSFGGRLAVLLCLALLPACGEQDLEGARQVGDGSAEAAPASLAGAGAGGGERVVEATSLLGEPLYRVELPGGGREELTVQLAAAEADLAAAPESADALIWVGRRTAYLGRFREAIQVFGRGVERFPDDPRFLRHRGHRYISTRQLEDAVTDLEAAAAMIEGREDEVEPDGIPNERGVPTSSLHSNIWYHLGLAHYLRGEFEQALRAYHECLQALDNDDHQVATRYWTYLTLRRLDRDEEAAGVLSWLDMPRDVHENHSYHQLLRFYRGDLTREELLSDDSAALDRATLGYGIGAWLLAEGDPEAARAQFEQVLESPVWAAFGYIASEAELARMDRAAPDDGADGE